MANPWVSLVFLPQIGGRLIQVTFGGHDYLFVNPRFAGKYFPPSQGAAKGVWFNYGGDKIWPLPEGNEDEQHWAGGSDLLDDGKYTFDVLSRGPVCRIRMQGPPDPETGLQYSRDVWIDSESPKISFHAVETNATGHPIRWSVQSVSQYNTADPGHPEQYNHSFWAFTPTNPHSVFNRSYDAHSGPIDHPAYSVRSDGMFTIHWRYEEGEVGIDDEAGWLAVVEGQSGFSMVERFRFQRGADYPERASVIFYLDGPNLQLDNNGMPHMSIATTFERPYYMEAEINSPLVTLDPGESYALDTEWLPTRSPGSFARVADAALVGDSLRAIENAAAGGITLSGSFGPLYPGKLVAHVYDGRGSEISAEQVIEVNPTVPLRLNKIVRAPPIARRVSLHLIDEHGVDRGLLGEVPVEVPQSSATVSGQ